jgi:hypothetical protein
MSWVDLLLSILKQPAWLTAIMIIGRGCQDPDGSGAGVRRESRHSVQELFGAGFLTAAIRPIAAGPTPPAAAPREPFAARDKINRQIQRLLDETDHPERQYGMACDDAEQCRHQSNSGVAESGEPELAGPQASVDANRGATSNASFDGAINQLSDDVVPASNTARFLIFSAVIILFATAVIIATKGRLGRARKPLTFMPVSLRQTHD